MVLKRLWRRDDLPLALVLVEDIAAGQWRGRGRTGAHGKRGGAQQRQAAPHRDRLRNWGHDVGVT
jgi:hypothetical protein